MKTEEFKTYIRNNPTIFEAIRQKKCSWQEAFEAYDIYGEQADLFKQIIDEQNKPVSNYNNINNQAGVNYGGINQFIGSLDVNKVNHLVDQLSQGINILKGVLPNNTEKETKEKQVFERFND